MDREQEAREKSAYEAAYNSALGMKGYDLAMKFLDDPYFVLGTILDIANKNSSEATGKYVKAVLSTLVDLEANKNAPYFIDLVEVPVNVRRR